VSGATVSEFLAYWESEGEAYVRSGDYEWMAALVPGRRVLEIGCGLGFGTAALAARGLAVLALDSLPECLAATRERLGDAAGQIGLMQADVATLAAEQRAAIEEFAPDVVVCWLMGAPSATTGATGAMASDGGQAVAVYREAVHRQVAELAARLPSVRALHLVDRTAIPWQAKDIGRDTLVRYHLGKTLTGLPFVAERRNALYRKLEGSLMDLAQIRRSHPSLKGVVPTLASLLAVRKN
jgi:SAM-dependent methyltransferase